MFDMMVPVRGRAERVYSMEYVRFYENVPRLCRMQV